MVCFRRLPALGCVNAGGGRAQRLWPPIHSTLARRDASTDWAALRRPLDGLAYVFRRVAPDGFARDDRPALTIHHHPTHGWSMQDPQTGELMGRPWDETQRHAPGAPAEGFWVTRKGPKSHVYALTHGEPQPPSGERVRPAWPSDLAAIAAFDEFRGDRAEAVAAANCLVALDATSAMAGYAAWSTHGLLGQPFLAYLCVRPDARRQGLATALLQVVHQHARGRWLRSSSEDWCAPMQTLFERLGWQHCGGLQEVNRDGSVEWFYRVAIEAQDAA